MNKIQEYIRIHIDRDYRITKARFIIIGGSYDEEVYWQELDPYFIATGPHGQQHVLWENTRQVNYQEIQSKKVYIVHYKDSNHYKLQLPHNVQIINLYDSFHNGDIQSIYRLPDGQIYYCDHNIDTVIPVQFHCSHITQLQQLNRYTLELTPEAQLFMRYTYSYGVEEAIMLNRDVTHNPKVVDKWLQNYDIMKSNYCIWPPLPNDPQLPNRVQKLLSWYVKYMSINGADRCLIDSLLIHSGWYADSFRLRLYYWYYYGYQYRKQDTPLDTELLASIREMNYYHRWKNHTECCIDPTSQSNPTGPILRVIPIVLYYYSLVYHSKFNVNNKLSKKPYFQDKRILQITVTKIAYDQSLVTHTSPFIATLCSAYSFALMQYLDGTQYENIDTWVKEYRDITLDEHLTTEAVVKYGLWVLIQTIYGLPLSPHSNSDDYDRLVRLYLRLHNTKLLTDKSQFMVYDEDFQPQHNPIELFWDHCWFPSKKTEVHKKSRDNNEVVFRFASMNGIYKYNDDIPVRMRQIQCDPSVNETINIYHNAHMNYQIYEKETLFHRNPAKKYGFEVHSANSTDNKCGRFVARVFQGVLTGKVVSNKKLDHLWYNQIRTGLHLLYEKSIELEEYEISLKEQRKSTWYQKMNKLANAINDRKSTIHNLLEYSEFIEKELPLDYKTLEVLPLCKTIEITNSFKEYQQLSRPMNLGIELRHIEAALNRDQDWFRSRLWNPLDLRIGMNCLGLDVGLICIQQMEGANWLSSYDFDKFYRPIKRDQFVVAYLKNAHWHFLSYEGNIVFTSRIFQMLHRFGFEINTDSQNIFETLSSLVSEYNK